MGLTTVSVCTLHSCKPVSLTLPFVLSLSPHSSSLSLSTFLSEVLSPDVAEMLLVVRRDVEEYGTWLNSDLRKWFLWPGHSFIHSAWDSNFCSILEKTNNILENKRRLTKSNYFRKCITGCWGVWALLHTRSSKENLRWRGISVPNGLFVTVYWLLFGFLHYNCIYILFPSLSSFLRGYALHCRGRPVGTGLSFSYSMHWGGTEEVLDVMLTPDCVKIMLLFVFCLHLTMHIQVNGSTVFLLHVLKLHTEDIKKMLFICNGVSRCLSVCIQVFQRFSSTVHSQLSDLNKDKLYSLLLFYLY